MAIRIQLHLMLLRRTVPRSTDDLFRSSGHNSYYFNNIAAGSLQNPGFIHTGSFCSGAYESQYIQLNRDYWLPTSGLEAPLPATCGR